MKFYVEWHFLPFLLIEGWDYKDAAVVLIMSQHSNT